MRRLAAALALVLVPAACTSGAPPGFAGGVGDRWAFPLVGPLEDGVLITPLSIDGHGPYLFLIDPDANVSAIDEQIVKEDQLRPHLGPHRLDESDTQQVRFYAEISAIELGSLIIERREAMVVKSGTFDRDGRRIQGLIGRDILADSLVFGFDRDRGIGQLVVAKSWQPAAGAISVPYQLLPSAILNAEAVPIPRRLANATIGGEVFAMHLDLGAPVSSLRESAWDKAKLAAQPVRSGTVDETGMPHKIEKVGVSSTPVALGTAASDKVTFAPYDDRRWNDLDVAGTLALDFFRPFTVWLDWNGKAMSLTKRASVPAPTRIARWDTGALGKCPNLGCVQTRMIDPLAGKELAAGASHPGVVLSITRDGAAGGMDLEVTLEASDRPALPRLVVNLPANVDKVLEHLKGEFAGATLTVVDASPFPRTCPTGGGCVDRIAR